MNKVFVAGVLAVSSCVGLVWSNSAQAGDAEQNPDQPPAAAKAKPTKPGKIKITHEARKVVSCEKATEEQETVCRPVSREPTKSGAKIKINPVQDDENSSTASALSVEIDNQVGEQIRVVEIEAGKWELVWQGPTTLRDKFFVDPGDQFDIALQTDVGVCRLKGEQCVVDPDKRQQSIEIPTERGL